MSRTSIVLCVALGMVLGTWLFSPVAGAGPIDTAGAIAIGKPFAMNCHGSGANPLEAKDIAEAGIQLDRADFLWDVIERELGAYDFSWYDALYGNLSSKGVEPLALLCYGNAYLFGPTEAVRVVSPAQVSAWLGFVNATVRHFPGIRQWEIWNEPQLNHFWNGTEEQFFYLLNATGSLIHSIDPALTVVSCGMSGSDPAYADRLISYIGDENFAEWFDAFAFHPYSGGDAEVVAASIAGIQEVCAKHAFPGEIWITEWGYATTSEAAFVTQDLAHQGALLTKVYALSLARNVSRVAWYSFREDGFGIQRDSRKSYNSPGPAGFNIPNPSGHAFATLSRLLTRSTYLPAAMTLAANFVPLGQLWAYPFLTASGHLVLIAWNTLGPYTLSISTVSEIAGAWQVDPLSGTTTALAGSNPTVQLGVETPVLLEIAFTGDPSPVILQILPSGYVTFVLFGLPALFAAGLGACIWHHIQRYSKIRPKQVENAEK